LIKKNIGSSKLIRPKVLGLTIMPDPRYWVGFGHACQTQAPWVWHVCHTQSDWITQSCRTQSMPDPRCLGQAVIPDPRARLLESILAWSKALGSDIVAWSQHLGFGMATKLNSCPWVWQSYPPILSRLRSLWWPENQNLCSLNLKTCFAIYFSPKTHIKHPRNHEKLIIGLKNPKHCSKNWTQPETKNQSKFRSIFSRIFKVQKHLI